MALMPTYQSVIAYKTIHIEETNSYLAKIA